MCRTISTDPLGHASLGWTSGCIDQFLCFANVFPLSIGILKLLRAWLNLMHFLEPLLILHIIAIGDYESEFAFLRRLPFELFRLFVGFDQSDIVRARK